MKLLNIAFLFLILSACISAQDGYPFRPYSPNTWEELKPVWYEPIYCDETKDAKSDGYNNLFLSRFLRPKVFGENVYFGYQMFRFIPGTATAEFFLGSYIQKRNWRNGELESNIYFEALKDSITERAEQIIDVNVKDGKIELLSLKKISPIGIIDNYDLISGGSSPSKLSKRIYNDETGDLLYNRNSDINDTSTPNHDIKMVRKFDFSEYFPITNNKIEVLKYKLSSDYLRRYYQRYYIDTIGRLISPIDSFIIGSGNVNYNIKRISEDLYVIANPDSTGMKLYHLNKDFSLIETYRSSDLGNMKGLKVEYFSDKYIMVRRMFGDPFDLDQEVFRFDLNAKLVNHVKFKKDGSYLDGLVCLDCERDSSIYLMSTISNSSVISGEKYITFIVLKGEASGEFEQIGYEPQKDLLRYVLPVSSLKLPNGNVLVEFEERAWENFSKIDGNAVAHSFAVFTPEEFGIGVTTSIAESKTDGMTIFPNPAKYSITISFEQPWSGRIEINDIQSRVLHGFDTKSSTFELIDLTAFVPGVYFVQFIDELGSVQTSRLVKL